MNIEKTILENEINVIYIEAESFPDGVLDSFQKLHSTVPNVEKRSHYGVSFPDKNGNIIYKACTTELYENEGKELGLQSFSIKKGEYISCILDNYMSNPNIIGDAFHKLLKNPDIANDGYCLEIYLSREKVKCLVPLK
ncbi:MAG: transcriptional regulator [Candidatus Sericytochromatia bacterium]